MTQNENEFCFGRLYLVTKKSLRELGADNFDFDSLKVFLVIIIIIIYYNELPLGKDVTVQGNECL
jgi:hypothetical protein